MEAQIGFFSGKLTFPPRRNQGLIWKKCIYFSTKNAITLRSLIVNRFLISITKFATKTFLHTKMCICLLSKSDCGLLDFLASRKQIFSKFSSQNRIASLFIQWFNYAYRSRPILGKTSNFPEPQLLTREQTNKDRTRQSHQNIWIPKLSHSKKTAIEKAAKLSLSECVTTTPDQIWRLVVFFYSRRKRIYTSQGRERSLNCEE